MYTATEICRLLEAAGLVDYQLMDENSRPLSARSRRMVVLARKPSHS